MLLSSRLGVAAGLLLALKEGTRKGRQEGEMLPRERCKLLFSSFGAAVQQLLLERIT
jgi:hypothetical protein